MASHFVKLLNISEGRRATFPSQAFFIFLAPKVQSVDLQCTAGITFLCQKYLKAFHRYSENKLLLPCEWTRYTLAGGWGKGSYCCKKNLLLQSYCITHLYVLHMQQQWALNESGLDTGVLSVVDIYSDLTWSQPSSLCCLLHINQVDIIYKGSEQPVHAPITWQKWVNKMSKRIVF